jgi:hypothetical protein
MSIIKDVSVDYFVQRFNGSIFLGPNGNVHFLDGGRYTRDTVTAKEITGEEFKATARSVSLPHDFFSDMNFLRLPPLGYRTAENGRYLCYFQRKNSSYTRGYTHGNATRSYADHTQYMFDMGKLEKERAEKPEVVASLLAKPRFFTIGEGLEEMNKGKLFCFANNPDIAVVPEDDNVYNVIFKQTHVANFSPEGELTLLPQYPNLELEFVA